MTDHVVLPSGLIVDLSKIVHCAPPDNRGYVWTSTGNDTYEFSGADARARKAEAPNA